MKIIMFLISVIKVMEMLRHLMVESHTLFGNKTKHQLSHSYSKFVLKFINFYPQMIKILLTYIVMMVKATQVPLSAAIYYFAGLQILQNLLFFTMPISDLATVL